MLNLSHLNYNVINDIDFFVEAERMSIDDFSKHSKISRNTIYEIRKNGYTTKNVYEKIYNYIYSKGYRINIVKEQLLKEDSKNIILFHGSRNGLNIVDTNGSRNNCDFGNGFYLGENYSNALAFVHESNNSSIYSFEINIDDLKVYKFECSLDWMLAICYFRGTLEKYKDSKKIKSIIESIMNVDLIIAPIADNRMFHIMNQFAEGDINANVALHSLSASHLGLQYVLKTDKAINKLKPIEKYYLSESEKRDCQNLLVNRSAQINTKLNLSKRQYKDGLYIEEILK